jgi:hypothetical protein
MSVGQYPVAVAQLKQVLCDIENVAGYTHASVVESVEWTSIVNSAVENRASYSKALTGKTLFSALHGTYAVTLYELKAVLKANTLATAAASRHSRLQWQVQPQWNRGFLRPYKNKNSRQEISHFRPLMQTVCLWTIC